METRRILEKEGYQPLVAPKTGPKKASRGTTKTILTAAGLLALGSLFFHLPVPQNASTNDWHDRTWADISPSRDLQWHACHDGKLECARLDVPMDWLEPTDAQRVYLAVVRAAAKTHEDYRGPVIVNPGGPGGSGVNFVVKHADELQTIIGDNHDIISFDPRGVAASVPRIDCWGSTSMRHDWERTTIDVLDAHPGLVYDAYALSNAFSQQCEAHISAVSPGLLENLSTASHARDMLAISEAAGYPRLKYWGISYGSILGGTFAAMFPDRVERLVSDGNVDYNSWYRLNQTNFFEDTDSIMEAFFHFCHKAGPDRCAFHVPASPAAIRDRFLGLLEQLKARPVLVPTHAYDRARQLPTLPELITYAKLQLLVRTVLYTPLHQFPDLAVTMAALEQGDGMPYYKMAKDKGQSSVDGPGCMDDSTSPMDVEYYDSNWNDAFAAITCSDGDALVDTPASFADYAARLQNISRYAGAAYTHFRRGCVGRQIRPRYRFAAPWPEAPLHTHFPILFIGNTGDNVTPLSSAWRNSAVFPGSAVLVQKSWGHASLAAPSTCTAHAIHAYFQEGRLPAPNTVCEQDYELFGQPREGAGTDTQTADELISAIHRLSREVSLRRTTSLLQ